MIPCAAWQCHDGEWIDHALLEPRKVQVSFFATMVQRVEHAVSAGVEMFTTLRLPSACNATVAVSERQLLTRDFCSIDSCCVLLSCCLPKLSVAQLPPAIMDLSGVPAETHTALGYLHPN